MSDLAGRSIAITGAASGIGEGLARGLARSGAVVIGLDVEAERGRSVIEDIRRSGGRAEFVRLDVSDVADIERAFGAMKDLNGLVNVAGVLTRVPLIKMTQPEFDQLIAVNLRGTLFCSKEAAKHMKEKGGGAIVNICSTNAHHGTPKLIHYAASKGGVLAMTRAMALELAPLGIRVNSVSPGVISTGLNADRLGDPAQVKLSAYATALGRIGMPEDLVGIVELLLSDRSSWITGADLLVDGGELA